ncbi:hypothetical protein A9Q99_08740 [Gammaproteobacteria bacterium 45_16_T64]|nr:hypothetical protein A9Q99_08740 [Gammaproteobacteria bacterium 45_16_T64]
MSIEVYKAPQSPLDSVSDTDDQTKALRLFFSVVLLFVASMIVTMLALYLKGNGYRGEFSYQVLMCICSGVLLSYSATAGFFAQKVGRRGVLWAVLILFFMPISLFVSFILIVCIGRSRQWFSDDKA